MFDIISVSPTSANIEGMQIILGPISSHPHLLIPEIRRSPFHRHRNGRGGDSGWNLTLQRCQKEYSRMCFSILIRAIRSQDICCSNYFPLSPSPKTETSLPWCFLPPILRYHILKLLCFSAFFQYLSDVFINSF